MLGTKLVIGFGILLVAVATAAAQSILPEKGLPLPIEIVPPTQHTQDINSVVFSMFSNGENRFIASSGDDGVIKLWDVSSGRLIRNVARIDPNNKNWRIKALSGDGQRLLGAVGGDGKVWDTITGKEILSIPDLPDHEESVVMSKDGSRVAISLANKILKVFDAYTGKELGTLKNVVAFALSPDGRRVVVAKSDKTLELSEAETGAKSRRLLTLKEVPDSIEFAPDGQQIAFKAVSGNLTLWDTGNNRLVAEVRGNKGSEFVFSPDGGFLAFQDGAGGVKIIDAATGALRITFREPTKHSKILGFSNDNKVLYFTPYSSSEKDTFDWVYHSVSISTGEILNVAKGEPNDVSDFGSRLYIEGDGEALRLRDIDTWQEVRTFVGQPASSASTFSSNGSRLAVALPEKISLLDAETGQQIGVCPSSSERVTAVTFSPDGRQILYGGEGKTLELCDVESGKVTRSFVGHSSSVMTVAFSPDGRQLASGDQEGTVKLWESATGRVTRTFKGNDRGALAIAFSPDGRKVLAGTDDNKVRIWDLSTGKETRTLRMLLGPVWAMAISPDGRRVAAGPYSQLMAKQWEIDTGKELRRLETDYAGRFWGVTDVKYATVGDHVLAAAGNNFIVVWDIDSGRKKIEISYRDQDVKSITFSADGRRLGSVDEAGVIRHWDRNTGALLLTIIPFGNGEWLRVTPEGFFDSSPGGGKYLSVVRGLDVYSIDQFYNQLHRPDLVQQKLAGDPRGLVRDAAAKLDLTKAVASGNAPRVVINSPASGSTVRSEQLTVEATIEEQGGGIGRIEWRLNGQTLGVEERGIKRVETGAPGQAADTTTVKVSRSFVLGAGENAIEVLAYNARNVIASMPAQIVLTYRGTATAARPRLHVLSIGVNDYLDGRLRLNFATPDAKAIGGAFERAGQGLYESVKVTTVLDGEVTRDRLNKVFSQLASEVRASDVFVLFVAGHGRTKDGHYYFIPSDFRYQDETSYSQAGLSQEQWQKWVSEIQATKSVLIYDTCESGSLTSDGARTRDLAFIEEQSSAIEKLNRATGRTVIVAASETQPALEGYQGHGVFSYAVLEGLGKAPVDKEGLIELFDLIKYIDTQVPELSYQAFKQKQFPQTKFAGSNFPLARPVAFSSDVAAPSVNFPTIPTHVVLDSTSVRQAANNQSAILTQLARGTPVRLIETTGGWMLVARDGKRLGYVEAKALLMLQ